MYDAQVNFDIMMHEELLPHLLVSPGLASILAASFAFEAVCLFHVCLVLCFVPC